MITVQNVRLTAGPRTLGEDLTFTLPAGSLTVLLGPNGTGKSTLLRCLAGLRKPARGQISVGSRSLELMDPLERARCLAWMASDLEPGIPFSVLEVILAGGFAHRGRWSDPTPENRQKAAELCRSLDLGQPDEDILERDYPTLSQGERQLVHLARILYQNPPVLVLDEPFSALDLRHKQMVRQLLGERRSAGHTILVSHHDLTEARRWADQVMVLSQGRLIGPGRPQDVLTDEVVCRVWGVTGRWTEAGDFRYDDSWKA